MPKIEFPRRGIRSQTGDYPNPCYRHNHGGQISRLDSHKASYQKSWEIRKSVVVLQRKRQHKSRNHKENRNPNLTKIQNTFFKPRDIPKVKTSKTMRHQNQHGCKTPEKVHGFEMRGLAVVHSMKVRHLRQSRRLVSWSRSKRLLLFVSFSCLRWFALQSKASPVGRAFSPLFLGRRYTA